MVRSKTDVMFSIGQAAIIVGLIIAVYIFLGITL